jgi:tripartite ATP-independent transporter DctM subunit
MVEVLVVVAIGVDVSIVFGSALARFLLGLAIPWSGDVSAICLQAITFCGGALLYRSGGDIALRYIRDSRSLGLQTAMQAIGAWVVIGVAAALLWQFPRFFADYLARPLEGIPSNAGWLAVWIGLGYLLILAFSLEKLLRLTAKANLIGVTVALVAVILVVAGRGLFADTNIGIDPLLPVIVVMAAAFLIGVPIAFVLATGGFLFIFLTDSFPVTTTPITFTHAVSSPLLVALPFFMVAGVLMELTGMASSLVALFQRWVQPLRGGLLMTTVGAMYVFSGMSGAKAADIAAVGSVMRGPLRAEGYGRGEFVAVLAASAVMGETVPPSLAILVLGSITSISIASLFLAGLIPALVLGLVIVTGVALRARQWAIPTSHFSLLAALTAIPLALPALGVPVVLIGGIASGIATPTETSAIAVIYGLIAAAIVYRSLDLVVLWRLLRAAALTAGMVLLIVSASSVLTQIFVLDGLDRHVSAFLTSTGSRLGFLALSALMMVVLGASLEGLPALILFAPILVPAAIGVGIDPIQFGIIMVIALGIGVFAPPIGVGLFIACTIAGAPIEEAIRPSLFYTGLLLIGLAILIVVPDITLWLPHHFGLK